MKFDDFLWFDLLACSRNCMGDVSRIQGELGYSKIIRNCYETPQAKGPQDAADGFLKHQTDSTK
jgi:hypothetical protein